MKQYNTSVKIHHSSSSLALVLLLYSTSVHHHGQRSPHKNPQTVRNNNEAIFKPFSVFNCCKQIRYEVTCELLHCLLCFCSATCGPKWDDLSQEHRHKLLFTHQCALLLPQKTAQWYWKVSAYSCFFSIFISVTLTTLLSQNQQNQLLFTCE